MPGRSRMKQREYDGIILGLVGITCNSVLAVIKICMGFSTNSAAVLADAFNNLTDAAASLALAIGFLIAGKTPDAKHPFGYGRMEYISGLIVSGLIMLTGLGIAQLSFERLWQPLPAVVNPLVLAGLGFSAITKIGIALFYRWKNKALQSPAIQAGITDSLSDAAVTGITLGSLLFAEYTPFFLDSTIGFAVAVIIFFTGFKSAKEALSYILGKPVDESLVQNISGLVSSIDGVIGIHTLIVHDYGPSYKYASAHIEFVPTMTFPEVHSAIEKAAEAARQILSVELILFPEPAMIETTST